MTEGREDYVSLVTQELYDHVCTSRRGSTITSLCDRGALGSPFLTVQPGAEQHARTRLPAEGLEHVVGILVVGDHISYGLYS